MLRLVILGCIAYLITGLGQLVIGSVMEPMVHAYGIEYSDGGQLVMHQFLGGMVGILFAPWLIDKRGKKFVLLLSIAFIIIPEFLYSLLPPWGIMLTIAPFAGIGLGMTEAVVGSLIIGYSGAKANTAMSRVETFFGVGALLIPFAGAALIQAGLWKLSFSFVGILSAITFVLWLIWWPKLLDRPAAETTAAAETAAAASHDMQASAGNKKTSKAQMRIILASCALFFFVYVGLEMSYINYLPSLLVNTNGLPESSATLAISLFWGAMVIGRLISGQIADRIGGSMYLIVTCFVSAILFVLMTVFTGVLSAFLLAFAVGFMMSGMFAIALVFANRATPGMTERTTSLLMACGGIGGGLLPKGAGWFLDQHGPDSVRWLFAGTALLLLAVILWASASARNHASTASNTQSIAQTFH
ncbi:sugar MFS transporter [Paenibacillus sp. OV219]|uniref:MFS transporter n=1 Tax=Paenibacillus sp. OV219 TaxID=1884377 RepID=UPI0008C315F0|nr:MFS transporter [Paenibacillus sp. OV219]SEO84101.1 MFS transporter, FHS family, glucose/mannose:H+ symporter [Paenibacillus sp. OV219]